MDPTASTLHDPDQLARLKANAALAWDNLQKFEATRAGSTRRRLYQAWAKAELAYRRAIHRPQEGATSCE